MENKKLKTEDKKIWVVPRVGLVVHDEYRRPIAKEGASVTFSTYWLRRKQDGDVTFGKHPKLLGKDAKKKD